MTDDYVPQESWNMATETLKRLSRSLDQISLYSQTGDLIAWFKTSMDLRRNLYPFLETNEFIEIENKINSLPNNWIIGSKVNPVHYVTAHKILDETYLIFIKCMKQKGLLMPKSKDARHAVFNMS
jgi:hypothetical protein